MGSRCRIIYLCLASFQPRCLLCPHTEAWSSVRLKICCVFWGNKLEKKVFLPKSCFNLSCGANLIIDVELVVSENRAVLADSPLLLFRYSRYNVFLFLCHLKPKQIQSYVLIFSSGNHKWHTEMRNGWLGLHSGGFPHHAKKKNDSISILQWALPGFCSCCCIKSAVLLKS